MEAPLLINKHRKVSHFKNVCKVMIATLVMVFLDHDYDTLLTLLRDFVNTVEYVEYPLIKLI
jgi:hypothetical protein